MLGGLWTDSLQLWSLLETVLAEESGLALGYDSSLVPHTQWCDDDEGVGLFQPYLGQLWPVILTPELPKRLLRLSLDLQHFNLSLSPCCLLVIFFTKLFLISIVHTKKKKLVIRSTSKDTGEFIQANSQLQREGKTMWNGEKGEMHWEVMGKGDTLGGKWHEFEARVGVKNTGLAEDNSGGRNSPHSKHRQGI